ncbi:MAG: carbohydrate ABC transporter permease [Lachnospiraceae bacterium]|nr:carbohydrate ABC transporter permease [Lachnospiraceae bacterium]
MKKNVTGTTVIGRTLIYTLLILLAVISVLPFLIMFANATRSTIEIQQRALSLIPSRYLLDNLSHLTGGGSRGFNAMVGFRNSFVVSTGATSLAVYFSSLTAYGIVAYDWKMKHGFFAFIMGIMMIPTTVSTIGFYQFMMQLGWTNNLLPLILPAIASPTIVFFMRQYLLATLSLEMVEAARIDGSGEFATFNRIVLPIMKPAIATQAIFVFVATWNNLLLPLILLQRQNLFTMPIMVSLLRGDIYRTELGAIYLGLSMTVLPLFVVYFILSKYIIAGVALGGVKE